jgi:hypothetical protein
MHPKFKILSSDKIPEYWIYIIPSIFILIAGLTFWDYGITWDEYVQNIYGNYTLNYYLSGGRDSSAVTYRNLSYYGPFFETITAMCIKIFPNYPYEVRHAVIALCSAVTLLITGLYSKEFKKKSVIIFAPLILLLMPRFYGHSFNNSKDIPFACFFICSIYSIIKLIAYRKFSWKQIITCSLLIGITLSIRIGGILLYFFLISGILINYILLYTGTGRSKIIKKIKKTLLCKTSIVLFSVIIGSWLIMVLFWPAAHKHPFTHPVNAFNIARKFPQEYPVRFGGKIILNTKLPFYYLLQYFIMTTPLFILVMIPVGIYSIFSKYLLSKKKKLIIPAIMLLLWFCFPITYVTITHPPLYDGLRHFLFLLPAAAILAALGIDEILSGIKNKRLQGLVYSCFILLTFLPLKDMILLHPYQMTYFNEAFGGVKQCWKKYETDYWTSSYKEAVEWVNKYASNYPSEKFTVLVAASSNNFICAEYYAADNVKLFRVWTGEEKLPENFLFFIGTTRDNMHLAFPYLPVVRIIGREGATFTVIKANCRIPQTKQK